MLAIYTVVALAATALAAPKPDGPVLGVTLTGGGPAATTTAVGPNPTEVTINSISYGGTGCPQNSVGSYISPDHSTFVSRLDMGRLMANSGVASPSFSTQWLPPLVEMPGPPTTARTAS